MQEGLKTGSKNVSLTMRGQGDEGARQVLGRRERGEVGSKEQQERQNRTSPPIDGPSTHTHTHRHPDNTTTTDVIADPR